MIMRRLIFVSFAASVSAARAVSMVGQGQGQQQGRGGGGGGGGRGFSEVQDTQRETPAPNVTFDRIRNANKEPQNWLTYSGTTMSQRHSQLTHINRDNAKNLQLKWVYQTLSTEKHEVTPL